jgi:hypothetical protein
LGVPSALPCTLSPAYKSRARAGPGCVAPIRSHGGCCEAFRSPPPLRSSVRRIGRFYARAQPPLPRCFMRLRTPCGQQLALEPPCNGRVRRTASQCLQMAIMSAVDGGNQTVRAHASNRRRAPPVAAHTTRLRRLRNVQRSVGPPQLCTVGVHLGASNGMIAGVQRRARPAAIFCGPIHSLGKLQWPKQPCCRSISASPPSTNTHTQTHTSHTRTPALRMCADTDTNTHTHTHTHTLAHARTHARTHLRHNHRTTSYPP